MALDGSRIASAATQLDVALQLASTANIEKVPRLIGQRAALDRIDGLLADVGRWTRGAHAQLEGASSVPEEVRRGIAALADAAEAARAGPTLLPQSAFADALEGARHTRARMSELVAGADAARSGSALEWLLGSTAPQAGAARVDAARDLAMTGDLVSLGGARAFLLRMDAADRRTVELANVALQTGPVSAGGMLLDDLRKSAASGRQIDAAELGMAFDAAGLGGHAPTWIADDLGGGVLDDVQLASIDLAGRGLGPDDLASRVRDLLGRPIGSLQRADQLEFAALAQLPGTSTSHFQADVLQSASALGDVLRRGGDTKQPLLQAWAADLLRRGGDTKQLLLQAWAADLTARVGGGPAALQATLDGFSGLEGVRRTAVLGLDHLDGIGATWRDDFRAQLGAIADDVHADAALDTLRRLRAGITRDQASARVFELLHGRALDSAGARELASLAMLPAELRPTVVSGHVEALLQVAEGTPAGALIEDMRWAVDKSWMHADPVRGHEFAESELRRIAALPDDQVGADQVKRLARLSELPAELRAELPAPHSYTFASLAVNNRGAGDPWAARELAHLRQWLQRTDLERDPTITAKTLDAEFRAILAKPNVDVTRDDIARLALLGEITGDKALSLPHPRNYSMRMLADQGHTSANRSVTAELEHMRSWLQRTDLERDPTITAQTLHQELRAILAKPDAAVTRDDVSRLALLDEITGDKAQKFPDPYNYRMRALTDNGYDSTNKYVAGELRHLRTWLQRSDLEGDPTITAQTLHEELRAILAKPDADITSDDISRLALLDEITGDKALNLPNARSYTMRILAVNGYDSTNKHAAKELTHLRTWLQRSDLEGDPKITAQTLHDEVRAILAKPDTDITSDDVTRLALLDDISGDKTLNFPDARTYSMRSLADNSYDSTNRYAAKELEHLRTWLERTDLERDPTITAQTLHDEVRAILAKPDADITSDDITRLALLDEITGDKALQLPTARTYRMRNLADNGYDSTNEKTVRELRHLRNWLQRTDLEHDPTITTQGLHDEVRAILAKPDADITRDDIARLALLNEITGDKALKLPDPHNYGMRVLVDKSYDSTNNYVAGELRHLRTWLQRTDLERDPTITTQALHDEIRAILAKPDADINNDDIARLALLDEVTGDKALQLPKPRSYRMRNLAELGYDGNHRYAAGELRHLRTWLQRTDLERDPTITTQALHDEVRAILAKPDTDISHDDIARLALLDELSGDKVLHLPTVHAYSLRNLADNGYDSTHKYTASALGNLRTWLQRTDLERDPTINPRALHEEARAILAKADADITNDDLARLALLGEITGDKALNLPQARSYNMRDLADKGYAGTSAYVTGELSNLRDWAYTSSPEGLDDLARRLREGQTVALSSVAAISGRLDELAARGVTTTHLIDHVVATTRANTSAKPVAELELMRRLLGTAQPDATSTQLHERTLELIQLNLDRMGGRLRDGYSTYPDLAEIGRIAENAELLGRLHAAAARSAPKPGTVAADTVVW